MEAYLLWHMRPLEGQEHLDPAMNHIETDDKLCGVFSTQTRVSSARQQLVTQPGFSDYPEAFLIADYEIDQVQWTEGFVTE